MRKWWLLVFAACGQPPSSECPNNLPAACPSTAPNFTRDVKPIVDANCIVCHAPMGEAAERPLTTYSEIFSQRSAVLNQVYSCKMPQPGAPSLTAADRLTLLTWLVCDAPAP